MAIGFTPKHTEDIFLNKLSTEQSMAIAIETAEKTGLQIENISNNGFIALTKNGKWRWNARITFQIEGDRAYIKSESLNGEILDWGRNKKLVERISDTFIDLKYKTNEEEFAELIKKVAEIRLHTENSEIRVQQSFTKSITGFLGFFIPKKNYIITPIIIDLNILVWFVMLFDGNHWLISEVESLIAWGGNLRPLTLDGGGWRLISCLFLHAGFFHLFFNMYALLYIGLLLEPVLGKVKYGTAYFLCGICASMTSLLHHEITTCVGASGAIFGMYGLFLALLSTNLIERKTRINLFISIGLFVAFNLLGGMNKGIDNAAHLGGLLSGIIIGFAFFPSIKSPDSHKLKFILTGGLTVVITVSSYFIYSGLPNDYPKYEEKMKSFAFMEEMALQVYHMPDNATREWAKKKIKYKGIFYWNENLKLLKEVEKMSLPDPLIEKNKYLIKYCNLRIKAYELMYRALDENTDKYDPDIELYNIKIHNTLCDIQHVKVEEGL